MLPIVAIPTEIAEAVRATLRSPVYDSPLTQRWPPTLPRAVTACAHSSRAKTAEFSLPMIASRESSRFLSPARSMFTRKPVSVIRSTPDFPRSLAKARALSRPTHTAAGFWPRNTLADGEFEPAIEKLLAHPNVDYLQVNSTTAGCFTFRIERTPAP